MTEHRQRAVETRLKRRRGMNPERLAALRAHLKEQEWHGHCRQCGATWTALGSSIPQACENCGAGGDG